MMTWLVSLVANTWCLLLMCLYFGRSKNDLPIMVSVALSWSVLAIVLSITCMVQEGGVREPVHRVVAHAGKEEFSRLLEEHRRDDC
jgi:hypothetical protein